MPKEITMNQSVNIKSLLTEIADNIDVGLHVYCLEDLNDSRTLRMVFANKASEDYTGVDRREVVGKTLDENFPGLRKQKIPQLYADVVRTQKSLEIGEVHYGDVRVKVGWFYVRAFPLPHHCMGVSFDNITERKKVEQNNKKYQKKLQELTFEISLAEERERKRIATDLHDCTLQNLMAFKLKLSQLKTKNSKALLQDLNKIIQETRSLVYELSPPVLYELGFEPATKWLAEHILKQKKIKCEFNDDMADKPLQENIRVLLFQAVRELLINTSKHSGASLVKIKILRKRNKIRIFFEDNGKGFNVKNLTKKSFKTGHFGLFNINERLSQIGGKMTLTSAPKKGAKITLTAPLYCK